MSRPLLAAREVTFAYGGHRVYEKASFVLHEGDKVALIGPNGAGKSTLFKLLLGELAPETGGIERAGELKIGYMPQIHSIPGDLLGIDVLRVPSAEEQRLQNEIAALDEWMAQPDAWDDPEANDKMTRYGELQERLARESSKASGETSPLLGELGIAQETLESKYDDLSGGEKTRLLLARCLANAKELDLIILDEPTNHLDLETVDWVEDYLMDLKGTVIVCSHDRWLLDNVATRTFEVSGKQVHCYEGNYTAYKEQKEAIRRAWEAKRKRDHNELKRQLSIIEELKKRNKFNAQVRSRKKRLKTGDPKGAMADDPYEKARKTNTGDAPPQLDVSEKTRRAVKVQFRAANKSSNDVMTVTDLSKSFGDRTLYSDVNFEIIKGDKVALVGPNGCGKTTLLKMLAGQEEPTTGVVDVVPGVKIGYFAQEHEDVDPEKTVLQEMREARGTAKLIPEAEARSVLGRFGFTGEDSKKIGKMLSGGERARLALSKFILAECNLLILDEPTNHLDLASQEIVQAALEQYPGTILVVSHDRSFMEAVCNKIAYVAGGKVGLFVGKFSDSWTLAKMAEFSAVDSEGQFKVERAFTDWESGKKYVPGETFKTSGLETQSFRRLLRWCLETGRVVET